MRTDHAARARQREADELRAKLDISYEEALKHAAKNGLAYPEAVAELAKPRLAKKGESRRRRRRE